MRLNAARASEVIAAAEATARAMGVPVVVAVLDAGVQLKAFLRMDGAPLGSAEIALKKARTAARFGLAPFGGGVPLRDEGDLAGAVGVSGGAVAQDREIAAAAASAFGA